MMLTCIKFTITSAPEDPYVSVHIRQVGDWTRGLGERVGAGPAVVAAMTSAAMKGSEKESAISGSRGDFVELDPGSSTRPLPAVRIDGPYGAPAEDVFNVEVAVLVGAGIGKLVRLGLSPHLSLIPKSLTFTDDIVPSFSRCHSVCLHLETHLVSATQG